MSNINSYNKDLKRKIFALSLIFFSIITTLILLYINKREEVEVKSSYTSHWDYRRLINIPNKSTNDLINEDTLITIDTASLISNGKLQNDCDDLRFVDIDNTTSLSHQIEEGCNTTTTQIWVRIPSLPSEGKFIYLYYGNDSAVNAEE